MWRISGFIISLLLLHSVCGAQDTVRYPINAMKGLRVGVDVSKLAFPVIYNGERFGFEASADVHVFSNMFAVVEAGWLKVNLDEAMYHYQENGMYGRAGIDWNLLKSRRPGSNDLVYAGVRYGFSLFNHWADRVSTPGYYWPDATDLSIPKTMLSAQWLELMLGVKGELLKNFYAGISFRFRFRFVHPNDPYSIPYQIPGYGVGNQKWAIGIHYYVSYNFHL